MQHLNWFILMKLWIGGWPVDCWLLTVCSAIGIPSPPENLTFSAGSSIANATVAREGEEGLGMRLVVHMSWSPPPEYGPNDRVDLHYTINITGEHSSVIENTTSSNFSAALNISQTYLITVYASVCDNMFHSDPLETNFTINESKLTS